MTDSAQADNTAPDDTQDAPDRGMMADVEAAPQEAPEQEVNTPENPEARPEWLPEKFRAPEDLVKAYNEMGQKIREKSEPPETYELTMPEGLEGDVSLSEDDEKAFREAGLTNSQAQKLVEYFHQSVIPELVEVRTELERDRLAHEWGVDAKSQDFSQKMVNLKSWAVRNLPEEVVDEMGRTASGVQTLERMMAASKAGNQSTTSAPAPRKSRAELAALMDDPRYAARDDTYIRYVQQEFQKAFD